MYYTDLLDLTDAAVLDKTVDDLAAEVAAAAELDMRAELAVEGA